MVTETPGEIAQRWSVVNRKEGLAKADEGGWVRKPQRERSRGRQVRSAVPHGEGRFLNQCKERKKRKQKTY